MKTYLRLVDKSVSLNGRDKSRRIDLGLDLARMHSRFGSPMSVYEIAEWCGCSATRIQEIERQALIKIRKRLAMQKNSTLRQSFFDELCEMAKV